MIVYIYREQEDISKTRNLFSESLIESYDFTNNDKDLLIPENENQKEIKDWINSQFSKNNSEITVNNLGNDLRSGVKLIQLIEVFFTIINIIILLFSRL